ncbi:MULTISPECIES: hypothetical protein [Actinomadura]|uniref:C2H2-type domain-containing protein n=1 Tax=Actinomadura litoris TaxID=2678616 RepID=A0A7K1L6F9_9ACTN|nr:MULTISPECIES: hypothetical protein [Actinomadura]MBT2213832.1 hypothetical protein [Actinomadura sp. NEAU-AAG7]MUN40007.1 hypothetical protein [Actinomadura litoris]
MHDTWSDHEMWVYECLACMTSWDEQFEVRHYDDGHGGEAAVYERGGQRCTTPWTDHVCPNCQSQNIKVFSKPLGRQAEVPKARADGDVAMVFHLRRLHAW